MTTPEDPRIWQGIRSHLDDLGSVATVPPVHRVLDRPRSGRLFRVVSGLATAGALVLAVGLLLPSLLAVHAPMTGATATSSSAPTTSPAPVDVAGLTARTFVATDLTENGEPIAIVAGTRIQVSFGDASHFGASAGCNAMGGDYEIRDGRLMTANVLMTAMGCLGEVGHQEGRLFQFLQSGPTISRDATGLVLRTGDVVITFAEEATT
jgi:heat shock protein HslJ